MTKQEVIRRILEYHPFVENYYGCDGYKSGYEDEICIGVATAIFPSVEAIREAAEKGCNLLVVHEPTFYTTEDVPEWPFDFKNKIYEEKAALIRKYRMTIWRDHDHMHMHQPDSIMTGVIRGLGWEQYLESESTDPPFIYRFKLPETTVEELAGYLKEKFYLNGLRYIGNADSRISKVAIVEHLIQNAFGYDHPDKNGNIMEYSTAILQEMENGVDAIIPGEVIEWTVLSYIKDAVQLGQCKTVFNCGHFNLEALGMKEAASWISELVEGEVPVVYINAGDFYDFY